MKTLYFKRVIGLVLIVAAGFVVTPAVAQNKQPGLSLKDFVEAATRNDTIFETILIDLLPLQYRRDALLPDRDVLVSLKLQHHYYLDQDRGNADASLSLSKLFPETGTELSVSYSKPANVIADDTASLQFLIAQPIAKNAFGKGIQLQDQIIGIENQISRYQIIEAYEDYLASLTVVYYNWYSAYENIKVGEASLQSTRKLLNNIMERKRQKIALPIDVNKMKLSLVGKQENLIVLQEIYDSLSNLVFKAIRHEAEKPYIPLQPDKPLNYVQFDRDYEKFTGNSRTYRTLNLLERQGTLEVKKAADDLLPSTNLLLGYQLEAMDWGVHDQENSFFAGIAMNWPIRHSVDKANFEITKIQHKKTLLSSKNKYEELRTNLKILYLQIQREQKLMDVSIQKIQLAESILRDESENYSFGKVSLNDYIVAVNRVDENRFGYTAHSVQLNKLLVEWLRLTDQLVDEKSIVN